MASTAPLRPRSGRRKRAVGATAKDDVVGAVDQAVERTLGEHRVGKERVPVGGWTVAGHHHAAGAVAATDELVQILGLRRGELAHAEVVEDGHVG